MNKQQLEEFRYDVAHALLSQMSEGARFQYALDRMLDLIADATEEKLCEMAPSEVVIQPKTKKRGGGF